MYTSSRTKIVNVMVFLILMFCFYQVFFAKGKGLTKKLTFPIANEKLQQAVKENRDCLQNLLGHVEIPRMFYDMYAEAVGDCYSQTSIKAVKIEEYLNKEEKKFHIKSPKSPVIVTIGVGKDTEAELALKNDLLEAPQFFGADPVYAENDDLFTKIGTFFPFAIGNFTGITDVFAYVDGGYRHVTAMQIDLASFLKVFIGKNQIDNIWIDAEGSEYGMMPLFHVNGELDQAGITICQMNLEVHNPDEKRYEIFHKFARRIMDEGKYIMLQTLQPSDMRIYMVNVASPSCQVQYLEQFFQ